MPLIDGVLEGFAAVTDFRTSLEKGAGAAGGLGFGLFLLGAEREAGIELVARAVGLARPRPAGGPRHHRARAPSTTAAAPGRCRQVSPRIASEALRPCIALAGKVLVGSREMRALGMDSAYSIVDLVGEDAAFADAAGSLALLAQRVARTWSGSVANQNMF